MSFFTTICQGAIRGWSIGHGFTKLLFALLGAFAMSAYYIAKYLASKVDPAVTGIDVVCALPLL